MWRVVDAGRSPTDASRSARYAGRWHHPAESLALYTASTRAVGMEEARDLRLSSVYPVTVAQLVIGGQRVVSLADVVDRLQWSLAHLLEDGRGYSRAILVGMMACRPASMSWWYRRRAILAWTAGCASCVTARPLK